MTYTKLGGLVFNTDDPDQLEMYKHLKKRKNKSAYLKRLLWNDMHNITMTAKSVPLIEEEYEPDNMDELMKGML